jgi:chloramphenicol-sensitive protein RarD
MRAGSDHDERRGLAYGLSAYVMWGLFPLFFPLLEPSPADEILAHRIVWSLVAVGVVLAVAARLGSVRSLVRDRRLVWLLVLAAVLIAINWVTFIYGVNSERVVEVSLGYFITPLLSVTFGFFVFRERLRPWQLAAIALATVAVGILAVDYGRLPWIALTLAASFGTYGVVRKIADVGAAEGLAVETLILMPAALAYVIVLAFTGDATFGDEGLGHAALLVTSGVVTAAPLLFYGAAVTRVPLVVLGLLFYVNPLMQFLVGVVVNGEDMPASRWIGFGLVWVALTILSADALRAARRTRAEAAPEPAIA